MRRVLIRLAALATAATAIAPAAPVTAAASGLAFKPLTYNTNGYNWGGYAAQGSGFTSVSATWTEPSATCNSTNDLYAPWVGIDGYGSSTVEQTGVATDCSSGSPVDQAWYEMYPASPVYLSSSSYPVRAGDVINASVTYSGSSKYKLTLNVKPPSANPHAHFGRHVDKETGVGPWFEPFSVDYEFTYAGTGKKGAY